MIESAHNLRGYAAGSARVVKEVKANIAALYMIDRLFRERQMLADTNRSDGVLSFSSMAEEMSPLLPYVLSAGSERSTCWTTLRNALSLAPTHFGARKTSG